ncbi:hypothetical protein K435DRAFT_873307 [Dendrothele bispora CBS 962.96]|uniref:Uncharacterized protein n=1 Tax=Dendrothele bispora (strain CBS 962.96) TaxID=1314807 RepID=A0A4S8KZG9_DENBC|nr:hypothetical protein K435DRAFT_873307 [Dendrothele bispora CBS 962.96]
MASYNRQNGRVEIPKPCTTRPRNPLRDANLDPANTERSSDHTTDIEGASIAPSFKAEWVRQRDAGSRLKKLLKTDQRSFLSGSVSSPMQAAHIINTVRRKGKTEKNEQLKTFIQSYLTLLGFHKHNDTKENDRFFLDHRPNLLLLTVGEHYSLDFYGLIAFSPGECRLQELIHRLKEDNEKWEPQTRQHMEWQRNLDFSNGSPYDVYTIDWEVLVFYPQDFLADGETFSALDVTRRSLRQPQQQLLPPTNDEDSWLRYSVIGLNDSDATHPPPRLGRGSVPLTIRLNNIRTEPDRVSLFAMMINLHSKLMAYQRTTPNPDPRFTRLFTLADELVDLIFYRPAGVFPGYPIDGRAADIQQAELDENADVTMAMSPSSSEDVSTPRPPPDDEAMDSDEPTDECSSDDDSDGSDLTESEYNILIARQSLPSLTDRQRQRNFMKILFGAQGYPSFKPSPTRMADASE